MDFTAREKQIIAHCIELELRPLYKVMGSRIQGNAQEVIDEYRALIEKVKALP